MGLLDSLADRLGYVRRESSRASSSAGGIDAPSFLRADADLSRHAIPDGSVVYNQADLYRRLSWLQGAVLVTAQTAAVTPFSVKRRVGEELRDLPNHPFEQLLSRPNPLDSQFELLEATFAYRRLCRNAYWWLNREGPDAPPDEIWLIPPYKIQPVPDGKSYLAGYAFYPEGMWGSTWQERPMYPLRTWEVVHFRGFNPISRFVGMSPVEALAQVAQGDLQEQAYNTNFFGENNAKIPGALAFRTMINNTDWKTIKLDIRDQFAGVERSGPLMLRGVGEGGVDWIKMGLTQEEMQFLESRDFNKKEIYDLVAPGLANVLDVGSSLANATVGKAAFIDFSVYPDQMSVGQKLTNDVLPSYDRRGRSLVGAFDDIRVVDIEVKAKEIAEYAKYHSTAEVRKKYYDGGDLPRSTTGDGPPTTDTQRRTTDAPTNGHSNERVPAAKAATLLADEVPLYTSLVALGSDASAGALRTLLAALTPIMAAAVVENAAVVGDVSGAPVGAWAAAYVDQVAAGLQGALQGGPGPGGWDWLVRMVVRLVVRARAYATQRLADWANAQPEKHPATEVAIVWVAQRDLSGEPDSKVCQRCAGLDGMPSDMWADIDPLAGDGPPLHAFCRCKTRVVNLGAVPLRSANGEPLMHRIKAILREDGEWELDVLGNPWGGPHDGRDTHGEFFSPNTKFHEQRFGLPPVFYYHTHDPVTKRPMGEPEFIGDTVGREVRADGVWYKVILDKTKAAAAKVWAAAQRFRAVASTATAEHLARADRRTGEILHWPVVDLSIWDLDPALDSAPANMYAVAIPAIKSLYDLAGRERPIISHHYKATGRNMS